MIVNNTPIETYKVNGKSIDVKREDLCSLPPGPPFSKMRGIYSYLKRLKSEGIETVGYAESAISMAGWGLAYLCHILNMTLVIFDPQYKETPPTLAFHRENWNKFHPTIVPIKAGRTSVNYYIGRKWLNEHYPNAVMLPIGMHCEETIQETAKEVLKLKKKYSNIIVPVGSGTICAGVVRGFREKFEHGPYNIIGIMSRSGDVRRKRNEIIEKSGVINASLLIMKIKLEIVDPGYQYTDSIYMEYPFPCNPFYDGKAWEWLNINLGNLREPILFWNIGQ